MSTWIDAATVLRTLCEKFEIDSEAYKTIERAINILKQAENDEIEHYYYWHQEQVRLAEEEAYNHDS